MTSIDFALFHIATVKHGEPTSPLYRANPDDQIVHVEYDSKTWAYAFPADWSVSEFEAWAKAVGFNKEFDDENGRVPRISVVDPELVEVDAEEPMFMNMATGSVDTRDGWDYICEETGYWVNAVARGEVVEVVKNANGDWVAK